MLFLQLLPKLPRGVKFFPKKSSVSPQTSDMKGKNLTLGTRLSDFSHSFHYHFEDKSPHFEDTYWGGVTKKSFLGWKSALSSNLVSDFNFNMTVKVFFFKKTFFFVSSHKNLKVVRERGEREGVDPAPTL